MLIVPALNAGVRYNAPLAKVANVDGTPPEKSVADVDRAPRVAPSPGHRFYETLNELLREAGFDRHAEILCAPYYEAAHVPGRKSVAPGVYFRMHLVGFFEGIESERGLEWRFADSLSLRQFLGLPLTQRVPDHSTLSRTRSACRWPSIRRCSR